MVSFPSSHSSVFSFVSCVFKIPFFVDMLGEGIFNADNDQWKWQRKVAAQMFSKNNFKTSMHHVFVKHSDILCDILVEHRRKSKIHFLCGRTRYYRYLSRKVQKMEKNIWFPLNVRFHSKCVLPSCKGIMRSKGQNVTVKGKPFHCEIVLEVGFQELSTFMPIPSRNPYIGLVTLHPLLLWKRLAVTHSKKL